jgi:hypothetical protein
MAAFTRFRATSASAGPEKRNRSKYLSINWAVRELNLFPSHS